MPPIDVTGNRFAELGVPSSVVANLADRGIHEAFPIQIATLPDALKGRDVCGKAPTGSGKTIAFGIPLVTGIGRAKPRKPRGLVLVPTRELATQVAAVIEPLAAAFRMSTVTVFAVRGITNQGQTSACDATKKTYETAIEAFYAQNGNSVHPTGDALVTAGLIREYTTDNMTITQGTGTLATSTSTVGPTALGPCV